MAHGTQTSAAPQRTALNEPHPTPVGTEDTPSKRDLTSWWKQFKRSNAKKEDEKVPTQEPQGIFGIPLQTSIRYANVAISLYDPDGRSYIYGYVPIVVAKCGVFLKEKATDVEGIFRLSGSEKRIKELRTAFNSPDRYGKGLDWSGYTVHDAANILRRYFNQLPEPIIPLEFYERFREPIRDHQAQAVGPMDGQKPSVGEFDMEGAIRAYQQLITELPPLNRQLLLYILDLLAVFASKSDLNKMTTANLAAIFQPGLLSHPSHDMAPPEYRLSQDVLIFLIENQDHFLIGMQGTAADEKTVQEVQSGSPTQQARTPTTPGRSKTVGRSGSTSSAGADSLRKFGGVRRNVSVSSRHSRHSAGPSPVASSFAPAATTSNGSGVHRSNTVPSKRSFSSNPVTFNKERSSGPVTPISPSEAPALGEQVPSQGSESTHLQAPTLPQVIAPSSSEDNTPTNPPPGTQSASGPPFPTDPAAETRPGHMTEAAPSPASEEKGSSMPKPFAAIFKSSPSEADKDGRKPNKLQKKRIPGSGNLSAASSTQSLPFATPLSEAPPSPATGSSPVKDQTLYPGGTETTPQKLSTGEKLLATVSPSTSFRSKSTTTDRSEADHHADKEGPAEAETSEKEKEKEKKRRWRLTGSTKKSETEKSPPTQGQPRVEGSEISSSTRAERSNSSGSANIAGDPRKSMSLGGETERTVTGATESTFASTTDKSPPSGKEGEKKNPFAWIKNKMDESKERRAEKRTKSPNKSDEKIGSLSAEGGGGRGKSVDFVREGRKSATLERQQEQNSAAAPALTVPTGPTAEETVQQ